MVGGDDMVKTLKSIWFAIKVFFGFTNNFVIPTLKDGINSALHIFGIATRMIPTFLSDNAFPVVVVSAATICLTITILKLVLGRQ